MLDRRRSALWAAMGLGPQWVERTVAVRVPGEHGLPANEKSAVRAQPGSGAAASVSDSSGVPIAAMSWDALQAEVSRCRRCALCESRKQTVFGVGDREAPWMLVGEAPGAEEDARGEPFVGQAGRLLDNMLASLGLSRGGSGANAVFIANVLKCRPPGNRNPQPEEVAECEPFLLRQIELIAPRIVVVMGRFAAQSILHSDASIASMRGRVHRLPVGDRSVPVIVTYHPAYLLRNLADKARSWADLCLAREVYEGRIAD